MTQIPAPTIEEQDVYSFGFSKDLNRIIPDNSTPVVYSAIEDRLSSLRMEGSTITGAGGIRLGKVQTSNESFLSPFDIDGDGTGNIRRVGAIKIASANDLGISTLTPAPTVNKAIYSDNTNDLRMNAPTTAAIVSLDTNGAQRVLVGVIKTGLTDAGANSIFDVALTAGSYTGGTIEWTCVADDGTDYQTRAGITTWAAVNKGGTYTTDVDEIGSSVAASAAGTLTGTWSILTGTNKITLQFTPTSSLTTTTLSVFCTIKNNNGQTITRV